MRVVSVISSPAFSMSIVGVSGVQEHTGIVSVSLYAWYILVKCFTMGHAAKGARREICAANRDSLGPHLSCWAEHGHWVHGAFVGTS
jgi:hypothetical protein